MKPNIVFAFADDWGRYASAYEKFEGPNSLNALIDTPNFDRIANEGAIFTNTFVPAPSCTPCRSSILSGQYFWQTGMGAITDCAQWNESIPTYPLELEKAGYHIGYTYKVWSPGETRNAPYGADRTAYETAGTRFGRFSFRATERAAEVGVEAAKEELYDETRRNFDAFIAARPEGSPFCYWWGPTNTHRKWQKGSGKALWGIEPDDLKGRLPGFLPDVHDIREDVGDYLGECMAVDGGLGVILDRLEAIGELDNTLIVVSGDHGIPGFPRAKCNLYNIGCEVAMAARWPGRISPGRVVEDFVNLMDLGPTFMEAADVAVPVTMTGKSLLPLFESDTSGQVDPDRTFVVTGRERHVSIAREGNLPYPQRAIRTKDFLYIHNFAPDRWPAGDPNGLDNPDTRPLSYESLEQETYVAYPDMDAGPTKAWMVHNRAEAEVQRAFDLGFGKRPREEFYDLRVDPHYMDNLADDPEYDAPKQEHHDRLMALLREQEDPRVVEEPCRFEHEPYSGRDPQREERRRKALESIITQAASVSLDWLDGSAPPFSCGVSWGVAWPRGAVRREQAFTLKTAGRPLPLQSWPLAYWPDGSLKWSGFATVAGEATGGRLELEAGDSESVGGPAVQVDESGGPFIQYGFPCSRMICCSPDHGHAVGDNTYASLRALEELVRRVRESHPDIFIEVARPPMDLGVWSLRHVDTCFTVDEFAEPEPLPGMRRAPLNIVLGDKIRRWSRVRVHRHFFPHWLDQPLLFTTDKSMRRAGIVEDRWPWESEGLDYILLSAMSCSPNLLLYLPSKTGIPEADGQTLRRWMDWGRANVGTLFERRDLPEWPRAGAVDGSAHLRAGAGWIFLFNPNGETLTAGFLCDDSIGFEADASVRLTGYYPESGEARAVAYGETVIWPVPAMSAALLRVERQ